ncbi:hypothetical protein ACWEOZ_21605 [Actinoplanes sp. NPDC004185]
MAALPARPSPPGLKAGALARIPVSPAPLVRTAEVSRLRKAIGALVATGPYRLALGVSWEVVGAAGPRPEV